MRYIFGDETVGYWSRIVALLREKNIVSVTFQKKRSLCF